MSWLSSCETDTFRHQSRGVGKGPAGVESGPKCPVTAAVVATHQETIAVHTAEERLALEDAARVLGVQGQQSAGSGADLGERKLHTPNLALAAEPELAELLQLSIEALLLERTPRLLEGLAICSEKTQGRKEKCQLAAGRAALQMKDPVCAARFRDGRAAHSSCSEQWTAWLQEWIRRRVGTQCEAATTTKLCRKRETFSARCLTCRTLLNESGTHPTKRGRARGRRSLSVHLSGSVRDGGLGAPRERQRRQPLPGQADSCTVTVPAPAAARIHKRRPCQEHIWNCAALRPAGHPRTSKASSAVFDMPRNRKAKKKLQSDFAKVRHKVGKKIPAAANATHTEIKSKRIALPGAPPPCVLVRVRLSDFSGTAGWDVTSSSHPGALDA